MPATDRTAPCPSCGYANQVDLDLCFVCGRSTRGEKPSGVASPSPSPGPTVSYLSGPDEDARRAYRTALANEEGVVGLLRFVYTLYAVGYLTLTVLLLVAGLVEELDGPRQLLLLLFPLTSLAVVLLAIRRLEEEPFAWALVMAGMETLAFVHALETQTHRALHALAAILLWSGVFMCARAFSVRRLWAEGVTTGRGALMSCRTTRLGGIRRVMAVSSRCFSSSDSAMASIETRPTEIEILERRSCASAFSP